MKKNTKRKKNIIKSITKLPNPDQYFFLCDGRVIKNILELSRELDTMNDDVFNYHVNESKNDFSKWIKEVFHEDDLAEELLTTTDKDKTQIIILKYLIRKFQ